MELFKAILERRSIRKFRPDPIPDSDLEKILELAIWAPSAGNLQSWEFVIVRSKEKKIALAKAAYKQMFIAEAPVVIVVGANTERSGRWYGIRGATLYTIQDTAAAIMILMLAAHALGYGTCWVGAFNEEAVSRIVKFPSHVRPVAIIPLGKPKIVPKPPPRLSLEEVVHCEVFGNKCEFR